MKKIFLSMFFIGVLYASDIGTQAIIVDDYPNSPETANYILLNTELQGSLETDDDVDWFKFKVDTLDGFKFTWKTNEGTVSNNDYVYFEVMTEEEAFKQYPNTFLTAYAYTDEYNPPVTNRLNLESGTYYIKVHAYGALTGYNFKIDSEFNDGTDWIPESQTVIYCQKYPDKCGIKPKVVVIPL